MRFIPGANASETISLVASNTNVDSATALGIAAGTVDLTSQLGCYTAIGLFDTAMQTVASHRAVLGATQAQLESTVRNLSKIAETQQRQQAHCIQTMQMRRFDHFTDFAAGSHVDLA